MYQQRSKSELIEVTSEYVEQCYPMYEKLLSELISFLSISDDPTHRVDVIKAIRWCGARLEKLREQFLSADEVSTQVPYPESLLAELGDDPLKPTLLLYGHVDVKAIIETDDPLDEPWSLSISGNYYEGHGLNDGKCALLCWIAAIDAIYVDNNNIMPVNIRFFIEGLGSRSSETLESQLNELRQTFIKKVDYVGMAGGFWLSEHQPCLIYGGRGIIYFYVTVDGPERELHSGLHGGAVCEPMQDLIFIMQSLIDETGHVLVQDFYQNVDDLESEELAYWEKLDFSTREYENQAGTNALYSDCSMSLLKRRWVQPELTVHKMENVDTGSITNRLIPRRARAKFSVRTVMRMSMSKTIERVLNHIEKHMLMRKSKNLLNIQVFRGGDPFLSDLDCINYACAKEAMTDVWGLKPDLIREGATLPAVAILERVTLRDVCILPLGLYSNAEASSSRLPIINVKNAIKVFASYLINLGATNTEISKIRDERQQKRKEKQDMLL